MLSELKKMIQNGKHVTDDEINFPIKKYRTLFLSDLHLGTRAAQAELLLDFLKYHDAETIYLVGDIVDGWRLKKAGIGLKRIMMLYRSFYARSAKAYG